MKVDWKLLARTNGADQGVHGWPQLPLLLYAGWTESPDQSLEDCSWRFSYPSALNLCVDEEAIYVVSDI
ncbi:hypothetical protein I3843_10G022000 [Carya illinoinensis]|nr:hypothetical protein I3843_10G022000 [Carya illinoinensis]